MHRTSTLRIPQFVLATLLAAFPIAACAQQGRPGPITPARSAAGDSAGIQSGAISAVASRDSAGGAVDLESMVPDRVRPVVSPTAPRTRADSIARRTTRRAAEKDRSYRIVISLEERRLRVLSAADTLLDVPAGVGTASRLEYEGREWTFETPRGRRRVLAKEADPVWVPPDWHYAEVALDYGFRLAWLSDRRPVKLRDGSRLEVREGRVGIVRPDEPFTPLPADEEIVFDSTLYVPPVGTANRRIPGELGDYRLDLGQGYLLHGTPHQDSIGEASTHGCVRLADGDIEWLFENVPLGTPVYIY